MALAYKISDLVVSASVEPEAFGRVAVEAQSMEKPIIASDIGGSNETIIDNYTGFLFKAGNPESLSKKIVEERKKFEKIIEELNKKALPHKKIVEAFNSIDDTNSKIEKLNYRKNEIQAFLDKSNKWISEETIETFQPNEVNFLA